MGREIKMVPANWNHPKKEVWRNGAYVMEYKPMYDGSYEESMDEWIRGYHMWKEGKHPDQLDGGSKECKRYAEWMGGPPDHEYYRPDWKEEDRTWVQVWETVSEGTPVTPPFATKEELVEYLVKNGDFWDQERRACKDRCGMNCDPWSREAAEKFVFGTGWAPSLIMTKDKVMSGVEGMAELSQDQD